MSLLISKELIHAKELTDQAKFGEALKIIENFENKESLSPEDLLSALLIKVRIYSHKDQFEKAVKIAERAFQISKDLGLVSESVEALIGKAHIANLGNLVKATFFVKKAERRLNSLADDSYTRLIKSRVLLMKSWILLYKWNINRAAEIAQESLKLIEEETIDKKLDLIGIYNILGWLTLFQGNQKGALDYAMKGLKLTKDLNHNIGISTCYSLLARIYRVKGDFDQALKYCKKCLSMNVIAKRVRLEVAMIFADVYYIRNEFIRSLKYREQALAIAEEINDIGYTIFNLLGVGYLYRAMGKNNLVAENVERSLLLLEKAGYFITRITFIAQALTMLILTYIDVNSREKANHYFTRLSEFYEQTRDKGDIDISVFYLISKAYLLKTSTRMRDHVEAQSIFKELIDGPLEAGDLFVFSLGNYCDLLLEELSIYNDPKLLDEIIPLITKSLKMAEETGNYYYLAETKLLQAKLALIQMNIEDAKKLMVEAQRIADLHGLNLLGWGISSEHDKLLDQIDVWNEIKKEEAPIAERIKLASTKGVLERIQGNRTIEPPKLVNEEPILLLIMDNSGSTYFNHPFIANWDYTDLFSSFMSAFNTFSSEIFSKSIDRIRIGENTILINPIEPFLACYVIKGQSYPALQKLDRFSKTIKQNSEIWQALNKSVKTSEMLELEKSSALKTVINEIFTL